MEQKLVNGQTDGVPVPVGIKDHITRDPSWSSSGWLAFYDETSVAFQFYYPPVGSGSAWLMTPANPAAGRRMERSMLLRISIIPPGRQIHRCTTARSSYIPANRSTTSELTRDNRMEDLLPTFSPVGNQLVSRPAISQPGELDARQANLGYEWRWYQSAAADQITGG